MRRQAWLGQSAHPRVGGENQRRVGRRELPVGSSPRGRGKRQVEPDRCAWRRLIPAWAGKTSHDGRDDQRPRAHPRVGGENLMPSQTLETICGSSPRGRGKLKIVADVRAVVGLIPAWAGKTSSRPATTTGTWAHPRVGGENRAFDVLAVGRMGSSPRGRGKQLRRPAQVVHIGLIPAWAGKTQTYPNCRFHLWAHPRVGGENYYPTGNSLIREGSSPRGRGKRSARGGVAPLRGLIPAWAGKTYRE